MAGTRQLSYLKMICPICGGQVVQGAPVLGLRSSKFHCSSCASDLRVKPTLRVVWAFVVAAIGLVVLFLFRWLNPPWPSTLVSALYYGIAGGVLAYSFALVRRGMVFRPA